MKYFLLVLILTFCVLDSYSQENKTKSGPVIKEYGQVFKIKKPDLNLEKSKNYKIIFDVYTDQKNNKKINASINTVARFLNMHAQNGVDPNDLDIVLVLHGAATKNALSDVAYQREFHANNPNTELIKALKKSGVKIYVCAQSLSHKDFQKEDLSKNVQMSLSALTALVYYQSEGYQLITFN